MVETSQQISWLATAVVGISLTILAFFLWKTLITSNLFGKGMKLYEQKDYPGAESAFRQVIAQNRNNDMVRLLLGNTLMQQGKLDEASLVFRQLMNDSPKNVDAYLGMGEVLFKQSKVEEAISIFQTARNLYKAESPEQKRLDQLIQEMNAFKETGD